MLKYQKGFTLIELLIVMGILGVLLTMTIIAVNPVQQFNKVRGIWYSHEMTQIANALLQCQIENKGVLTNCYRKLTGYSEALPTCYPNTCGTEPRTADITADTPYYSSGSTIFYWPMIIRGKDAVNNATYYQYMVDLCPLVEQGYLPELPSKGNGFKCSTPGTYNYAISYYFAVQKGVLYVCPVVYVDSQYVALAGAGVPFQSAPGCVAKKLF